MPVASTYNIVITDSGFPSLDIEREIIKSAGSKMVAFQCKTEADVIAAAGGANALIVQWAPITRAVIQTLSVCNVIVRYGIGTDNVDLVAARDHGIPVCNIPDYCVDEVADHTFAMAMSLVRQIQAIDHSVRQNVWKIVPPRPMLASRQMRFVTLGYGRIAREVLQRARACKFDVAACDPYLPTSADIPGYVQRIGMQEALESADLLSLHVPLTDGTFHLINAQSLHTMKDTSILLNTARGGLVDTIALAEALCRGQIGGAGLDVFEKEPLEANHPLRKSPNVLLTSHVAWYSEMSVPELQRRAAQEAVRALTGEPLQHRIM